MKNEKEIPFIKKIKFVCEELDITDPYKRAYFLFYCLRRIFLFLIGLFLSGEG